MKNLHFALDSQFVYEKENFKILKSYLDKNEISNEQYTIVPFSHEIIPPLISEKKIIPIGTIEFVQKIKKDKNLNSIIYFEEDVFTNENCIKNWKSFSLNHKSEILTIKEVLGKVEPDVWFFMRPSSDLKSFSGKLFQIGHIKPLLERYSRYENNMLTEDSIVIISTPKEIKKEWRFFIIDGQIITSSMYRSFGGHREEIGSPEDTKAFCRAALKVYNPYKAFVLDVCQLEDGHHYIVEFGCINNCGFYAADIEAITKALIDLNS